MSERFPKQYPELIKGLEDGKPHPKYEQELLKGIENYNKPPRYRTLTRELIKTHEDGDRTERVLECNGHLHRSCLDRNTYDADGEVTYADQLARVELGECDAKHS